MSPNRTWRFNRHLVPVKLMMFSFTGGIQSVLPYVSVHMKSIGLSIFDITIINALLPVFATSGPPLMGMCADKLGRSKLIFAIALILTAFSFSGLLLAPSLRNNRSQVPSDQNIYCEDNALQLIHKKCDDSEKCPLNMTEQIIYLESCNVTHLFCSNWTSQSCSINASSLRTNLTLSENSVSKCIYRIHPCQFYNCTWNCNVKCNVTLKNFSCRLKSNHDDWHLSFVTFFILRSLAQFFMSSCFALLDSVILEAFQKYQGKYGRHRIWPTLAQITFPFLVGYVMDYTSSRNGSPTFWPAYLFLDILFIICIILLTRISFSQHKMSGSVIKNVRRLISKQTLPLFLTAFAFGIVPGFLTVFLPIFVKKLNGSMFLIGLMSTTTGIASLFLLFYSDVLVKKIGHWIIIAVGFFLGAIRLCAYSFIWDPWMILGVEFLKAFAQNLPLVALIVQGKSIVPPGMLSTMVGVIRALVYGCGRTVGVLLGGLLISRLKYRTTFQIFAFTQLLFGALCLVLNYTTIYQKQDKPETKKTEEIETIDLNTSHFLSSNL